MRRSTMSPADPAGSASRKNGRDEAVCVSATYMGPAPSETISQAAPTLCMKVPISETTSATNRLRKVGTRRGRNKLEEGRGFRFFAAVSVNSRFPAPGLAVNRLHICGRVAIPYDLALRNRPLKFRHLVRSQLDLDSGAFSSRYFLRDGASRTGGDARRSIER